jgi:hypothetical protein
VNVVVNVDVVVAMVQSGPVPFAATKRNPKQERFKEIANIVMAVAFHNDQFGGGACLHDCMITRMDVDEDCEVASMPRAVITAEVTVTGVLWSRLALKVVGGVNAFGCWPANPGKDLRG